MMNWNTPRYLWPRKLRLLLSRDDFRRHPFRSVVRRVVWRMRWSLYPERLWKVRASDGFPLFTKCWGAGALIYYQGASEPDTAGFIRHFLKPGMVFADVGANLGEYTLLAAHVLGTSGRVHAFEPNPNVFEILRKNIELNHCGNVTACPEAVWERETVVGFELTPNPGLSAVQPEKQGKESARTITVRTVTLDNYFADATKPNLIKVDVEGAELQVLNGATSLLALPPLHAPVVIFEYGPCNTQRFRYAADSTIRFLRAHGYVVYGWHRGAPVCLEGPPVLPGMDAVCNLVATKRPFATSPKPRDL